jgi:UDP-N-acetylmuramate: L-alanyl-gamma-D-glutamyl-meso-diaminopimelate ligase
MKTAHFIGIAGVGMSATAILLREKGWHITGSDEGCYPPISDYLQKKGISICTSYAPENIPKNVDLIVIGKSAKLTIENTEVQEAHKRHVPKKNFPEVLSDILKDRNPIVVAGSFGKSTVATLMAWILVHAGKDPGYLVGAVAHNLPQTSQLGSYPTFVIEGDEYPSGHDDPQAKFLHYHAHDLLLTSAVHDHVNVFPTHESYLAPFKELVASIPKDGLIVACADDVHALNLMNDSERTYISYGVNKGATWSAYDIVFNENGTTFSIIHENQKFPIKTSMLGKHNVQNIVGAAAMLMELGLVTPQEVSEAVSHFSGVVRRLDLVTNSSSVPVFEGFGSSYEKARTAIDALRLHFPKRRLVVLFEPHTFSWRNRAMLHWYDTVFSDVQLVFVYPPPVQEGSTHEQIALEEMIDHIKKSGSDAVAIHSFDIAIHMLKKTIGSNDVVLILTSGDMDGLVRKIPLWMDAEYNHPH